MEKMNTIETIKDLALAICDLIYEKKGDDIVVLDISSKSDLADYFVIASAKSPMHLRALANELKEILHDSGLKPKHIEGLNGLKWILIDYGDIIVHLFLPQARDYYGLEEYWSDAPKIAFNKED